MRNVITVSRRNRGRGFLSLRSVCVVAMLAVCAVTALFYAFDLKQFTLFEKVGRNAPVAQNVNADFQEPLIAREDNISRQSSLTWRPSRSAAPYEYEYEIDAVINGFENSQFDDDRRSRSAEPEIFKQLRNSKSQSIPKEVRDLAADVTRGCTNDLQKAHAIYDWLTKNIKYDSVEWAHITGGGDNYTHDHSPAAVLERGTTVCIGYAWLFDAMCASVGLDSTYLIGDVRGYRGTPDDELVSAFKHAWNAVKLDGSWSLLDATWGAVQEGEAVADAAARSDYYFMTPASQFVYDHLPEADEWQLLDNPMSQDVAFSILPNLKPSFFINGIRMGEEYTSAMKASSVHGGRLTFTVPAGVSIAATLGGSDAVASTSLQLPVFSSDGITYVVVPKQPSGSEGILRLYSKSRRQKAFDCSADFAVKFE